MDWINLAEALAGRVEPTTLDDTTRAEYDRIVALRGGEEPPTNPADLRADHFWEQTRQYETDVAADLARLGLNPDGPDSHEYFLALASLRPVDGAGSDGNG